MKRMVNQFLLLKTARKLEGYLGRESYNLDKMKKNNNVSTSFMESKVGHYNELVETLNTLFSGLTGDTDPLFDRYVLYPGEDLPFAVTLPSYEDETSSPTYDVAPEPVTQKHVPSETSELAYLTKTREQGVETPAQEEALVYDEPAPVNDSFDTTIGQQRAAEILDEYEKTATMDIAAQDPEHEEPVAVFGVDPFKQDAPEPAADEPEPESDADTEMRDDVPVVYPTIDVTEDEADEEPRRAPNFEDESDLSYVHSTSDGTRVDNNPIQIADVETAVEREGASGNLGASIDVSSFLYQADSEKTPLESFMDAELGKYAYGGVSPESDEESDDVPEDAPTVDYDEDDDVPNFDFNDVPEDENAESDPQDADDDAEEQAAPSNMASL